DPLEGALEVPAEAVELALQFTGRPGAVAQSTAAVQARVPEAADDPVRAADQQDREVRDLVDLDVADLTQPFLPTGELPDVAPDPLLLQGKHVAVEVEADRDVRDAEVAAAGAAQERRDVVGVGVEQVGVAGSGAACRARLGRGHPAVPSSANPA